MAEMNKSPVDPAPPFIALAMSGGGSRAMAFHLGCLRALHDRGLLKKVRVISTVSGGSVIGACLAYWGESFAVFDSRIERILKKGFNGAIARSVFFSWETPKILATLICNAFPSLMLGVAALSVRLVGLVLRLPTSRIQNFLEMSSRSLPVWGTLTTAFENTLRRDVFGSATLPGVKLSDVEVVVNACDLRTGTAFRFGSKVSGGWRYGRVLGEEISVAKAVAASAAFPLLLPPLVENFTFERGGKSVTERVVLTDGGVYENLGVAPLEPNKSGEFAIHRYPVTHIISLNAGPGQESGQGGSPFWLLSRIRQSFETVHRKVQDATYARLHRYVQSGELAGFGMVYLGQIDQRLPVIPSDLVSRASVRDYPTNFSSMSQVDIDRLALRGEQLTHVIVDRYLANL